jgi:NhaA family Na+:H+ antiporter
MTRTPGPLSSTPPGAWPPLLRLARFAARPLERFLRVEAASGILLLLAAALALVWANSPWAASYTQLWHAPLGIRVGALSFERPLEWFVNDGLMVIFFFVVGLEIRREVHGGELSEWRRAALPAAAALGGMLAPAGIYLLLGGAPETRSGWGVPMATDIAFAVGVLALLGARVPAALRVLLLALAVIDDLGAIIVIALFYSAGVSLAGLCIAAAGLAGVLALQRFGVRSKAVYILPSLIAWAGVYASGIHPTIAGVIVGLLTPVEPWLGTEGFVVDVRQELDRLTGGDPKAASAREFSAVLRHVDAARREAMSPGESLIEKLHPWVAFGIMPIFALANAGVSVDIGGLEPSAIAVATAVAAGLIVGKPIGILLLGWLTLRLGIGTLPVGMSLRHLVVLGVCAGVGFTMSLFIAQLAFSQPSLLAGAKLGVLGASTAAGLLALALGRWLLSPTPTVDAAQTADEAERSTTL